MEMANLDDKEEKWIKHYSSRHEILLVGEGDFSFAACLARSFGSAANMVATSLDSKEMLKRKYSGAMTNLEELKELGCTIIHGVDANTMSRHALLKSKLFDQIVFNFPHAGFLYREQDIFQIKLHQNLVQGFLRNASDMLTDRGEVHITHKTAHPFGEWKIEKLAKEVGLGLFREESFWLWDYPGYGNKRGDGDRCDYSFSVGQCSTFKFRKPSGLADQFSGMRISTDSGAVEFDVLLAASNSCGPHDLYLKPDRSSTNSLTVSLPRAGVNEVAIQGKEKDELVVIGDEVDSVKLARCLRKKLRTATILSVKEKKKEKKEEKKDEKQDEKIPSYYDHYPIYIISEVAYDPCQPTCSIL
ncbi:hypothetical protein SCA6_018872 [Theobroma cacao]